KKWNDHYKQTSNEKDTTVIANGYKILIQDILDNEFDGLHSSLPSPNFTNLYEIQINEEYNDKDLYKNSKKFDKLTLNIINNPVEFPKFGLEILEVAIENKIDSIVQKVFDKILDITKNNICYYNNIRIISLHLPKLCNHYYSNLVMKYIIHTSILLNPSCPPVENSTNTSLCAYSIINIKKRSEER